MSTFVALYRGQTVASAKLIAVTADPVLVADVSSRLLNSRVLDELDPITAGLVRARRTALRLIQKEARRETGV